MVYGLSTAEIFFFFFIHNAYKNDSLVKILNTYIQIFVFITYYLFIVASTLSFHSSVHLALHHAFSCGMASYLQHKLQTVSWRLSKYNSYTAQVNTSLNKTNNAWTNYFSLCPFKNITISSELVNMGCTYRYVFGSLLMVLYLSKASIRHKVIRHQLLSFHVYMWTYYSLKPWSDWRQPIRTN